MILIIDEKVYSLYKKINNPWWNINNNKEKQYNYYDELKQIVGRENKRK